jgi:hypothetical protein
LIFAFAALHLTAAAICCQRHYWNSYSEITDDNLSYPFSAIAGAVIDRDQYTDTPSRTYHLRGLIVSVPDNYDPIARTYSGLWTGGFKQAWTNNPAGCSENWQRTRLAWLNAPATSMLMTAHCMFCLSIAISLLMMGTAAKSHA